ncbi:hypothetical protein P872_23970 [Rhodonellum psychrophilum GCM71 = DSM 17998]|uniref:Uncharacterized protein n=2 Tax=Rhodonellum TaxID=336827 RepID=U5C4L9_9BACT|nr:hypothetical protein P872_23970 [Rhodonellum psychrophilum GCM71 = DSM 17998]SDZ11707.1 hypothetical protein SAMN05444412_10643 [Rhodonellum ikkaensis]
MLRQRKRNVKHLTGIKLDGICSGISNGIETARKSYYWEKESSNRYDEDKNIGQFTTF